MANHRKRITIKNIADEVGVSVATVDRALNNRQRISSEMRERILETANEKGYRPNSLARTLSKNKTVRIVVLTPGNIEFWELIRKGVRASIAEWSDFNVEFTFGDDFNESNIAHQLSLLERQETNLPDGVLVTPFSSHIFKKPIERLVASGIAVVTVNRDCPDSGRLCYVGENAFGLGYTIGAAYTRFLHEGEGVAVLSVNTREDQIKRRTAGFIAALNAAPEKYRIIMSDHEDTKNSVHDIIAANLKDDSGIKAVFANTAQGAYWAASVKREMGLSFLLSGIDTAEECLGYIDNRLMEFTVSQNPYVQGYTAARIMLNYLVKDEKPGEELYYTNVDIILDRKHYLTNWHNLSV